MKVYTTTGDEGTTSLLSGGRVSKDHPRLEAYGTVDELNSVLGLLRCEPLPSECMSWIEEIQNVLFAVGSALADAEGRTGRHGVGGGVGDLESWIDAMDADLPELGEFILPGGSRPAALSHLARTVCRRAERRIRALDVDGEPLAEGVLPYLNRLSDFLFVLARYTNQTQGIPDPRLQSDAG